MQVSRTRRARWAALAVTVATSAGLLFAAPQVLAKPTPPPNPSDQQINSAAARKQNLANQVGVLGGQIAQAEAQLQQLQGRKELAEQKVALAYSKLQLAQQKAAAARLKVQTAERTVARAHTRFVQFVQASYMEGTVDGTTGTLLSAQDPTSLLNQSTLEAYQAQTKIDAIGTMQRASVIRSNAEAASRLAVANRRAAANRAQQAKQAADDAVAAQQAQEQSLQASLASSRSQLDSAQAELATLNNQRATYNAYVAEQARLAAIARAKAARERARRLAAARAAAAARQAAAEAAALAAARRRHHHNGGGGNSGGGGGGGIVTPIVSGPRPPSGGGWTAGKGRKAVRRAMTTLGMPYAWAGGNQYGPTSGVCDASNGAPNDCYVVGWDCSGLTMYAWGRGWDHYAATQFSQAGSYHPNAGNLMPGDLIFWSFNGSVSGIHHVALYKGGGEIIEEPYSGGQSQIASLYEYGSFFGATRPLT